VKRFSAFLSRIVCKKLQEPTRAIIGLLVFNFEPFFKRQFRCSDLGYSTRAVLKHVGLELKISLRFEAPKKPIANCGQTVSFVLPTWQMQTRSLVKKIRKKRLTLVISCKIRVLLHLRGVSTFWKLIRLRITVCVVATSCCISDVPRQWESENFDPHSSHIFQPILIKLETKKDIQDTTLNAKFG